MTGLGDDWIRIGNVKLFADGALGSRTAAMRKPYEGEPENLGMALYTKGELIEIFMDAGEAGLALAVHAIGDQAVYDVIDAFGELRKHEFEKDIKHLPHRIEHLQLIDPDNLPNLVANDIIASMQPVHATSDMDMAETYWGDRVKHAYAWRSVLEAGGKLAFGSDAPVESANPFWGLHAAITRCRRDEQPDKDGWTPREKLDLHAALEAYTKGPASVGLTSSITGCLKVGDLADLIVLEKDPYTCTPEEISSLRPLGTMVNGRWRYREF